MRNLKKFLALVLAMMMTLSLMVTVNAATPTDFSDGDKITPAYKEAVDVLSALEVVKGDDRGFRPGETITRAEVSAILYRIVTGDVDDKNAELYKGANYFTDVTADRWYDGYVNYCANNGLVLGVGGGKFNPNAPVTGYEALVMILRAIGYNNPKEFSSGDWKLKASGYGRRLGITNNIAEARLVGPATREMVAEIMFQGLKVPTRKYTILNDYEKIEFGRNNDGSIRYEDLLLRVFGIGGKSPTPVRDNYGNPSVRWYYWVGGGNAITIPVDPVDTFYTAMDECTVVEKLNEGEDINVTNEFLNGRAVEHTNSKGEIIDTRKLDALHTTNDFVGAQGRKTMVYNYTIEAYGYSKTYWDIVYIDTYLGEVKAKTPATLDTNGHTMHKATLSIEVGAYDGSNAAHPYAMLTSDKNFDDYNVGDVLLLNTWSPSAKSATTASVVAENGGNKFTLDLDWATLAAADALTVARLTTKASARPAMTDIPNTGLAGVGIVITDSSDNNVTPVAATAYTFSYQGSAYPAGTYTVTVDAAVAPATVPTTATITYNPGAGNAVIPHATHDFDTDKFEIVSKATEKTVTISGTTGAADDKTGIYVGNETIMANVVYHMHNHTSTADAVAANNSTPTTAADFYNRIVNEQIGKTYRLWLDGQGNILGMKPATAASVGVVVSMEAVRVSASRYAVEATLFMEDESTITARFLDDTDPTNLHQYFASDTLAAITEVDKNALLEISSYTKNGQTYYQVEDSDSDYANAATSGTVVDSDHVTAGNQNIVHTGKSDTLGNPNAGTPIDRVNGDTVFFVAYKDFQYNWGTGNTGGNDDIVWKVIRDFRDIPTITGDGTANQAVVQQTLKPDSNGVAEYAAITCQNFTDGQYDMTGKTPVAVDDSYLIIAPIGTYARYSEYAVMHNGVKETLKVANLNGGVNTNVETAMATGQLVTVSGWNMENAAINVAFVGNSNVVKGNTGVNNDQPTVSYDNAGVLTLVTGAIQSKAADGTNDTALAADAYMTMAKDVKVMIVNRDRNEVYEGTTGSIAQYASYTGGHAFAWELDANGYISTLYILD